MPKSKIIPSLEALFAVVVWGAYGMGWFVEATEHGMRLWRNGQVPDYFAYMPLLPEQNRGLVLPVNANQIMMNFALLDFGEDTAALLAGIESEPFACGVFPWIFHSFLLILVFQFIGVIVIQRRLKHWQ